MGSTTPPSPMKENPVVMTTTLADETVTVAEALIGFRRDGRPIHLYAGADGIYVTDDETGSDDPDDERDDSDDEYVDDDDDAKDAWTPPSREDWDGYQAALKRNNQEHAKLRGLKNALRKRGIDPTSDEGLAALDELFAERTGKGKAPAEPGNAKTLDRQHAREVEMARAEAEETWKGVAARQAVVAELVAQGLGLDGKAEDRKARLARALKLVDLDQIDIDADGNVTGADSEVAELKRQFPALFTTPAAPRRSGAADVDGGDKRGGAQSKGWREKVNAQFPG